MVTTRKVTESGENERFMYGLAEMQGWRITMEDAHAAVLDLEGPDDTQNTFFAVYDGHGGSNVAKFAGQHVHKRLVTEESYKEKDYETALKRAFLGTDEDLLANPAHTREPSGCTAVAALITSDNKIYVANAGDSRTVIGIKGEVKPLSFDHKPTSDVERARIAGAGGYIEYGRVNGNLALSRALGDFDFKKNYSLSPEAQIITANPDVTVHEITEDDEFLVLACDGIWDCLSSQQVVDFVRSQVAEGKELTEIGGMMCDHCLAPDTTSGAGIGCDNMTVLIVAITHGRTKEEWYAWIKERVANGVGYQTPTAIPQLYSQSRLLSFRARKEAQEARERLNEQERREGANGNGNGGNGEFPSTFASVFGSDDFLRRYGLSVTSLSSGGGISYRPGGSIVSDSGQLMFGSDDSEEEDSDEDSLGGGPGSSSSSGAAGSNSVFGHTLGLGSGGVSLGGSEDYYFSSGMGNLKAQIDDFEKEEEGEEHERKKRDVDSDGDSHMGEEEETDAASQPSATTTTKLPNGDISATTPAASSTTSTTEGPEPSSAEPLKPSPEAVAA